MNQLRNAELRWSQRARKPECAMNDSSPGLECWISSADGSHQHRIHLLPRFPQDHGLELELRQGVAELGLVGPAL